MNELNDLFQDVANTPAPPSRLLAEEVYTAGRRRHRRIQATRALAAVVAVVAVGGLATTWVRSDRTDPGLPIAGRTGPATPPRLGDGERIVWTEAADARHVYLSTFTCVPPDNCDKTTTRTFGSDDGGRTWTERGEAGRRIPVAVLGVDTLVALDSTTKPSTLLTSTDGGRRWSAAQPAAAVDAVPNGQFAFCWPTERACLPYAVDPTGHRMAPLTSRPALALPGESTRIDGPPGRLQLPGVDPTSGRPAVAVSADAGRTWSTHVFAEVKDCPDRGCIPPTLTVARDGTTYAVVAAAREVVVFRQAAGVGGWQRTSRPGELPSQPGDVVADSGVTADGSHLVFQRNENQYPYQIHRASRKADSYLPIAPEGLPAHPGPMGQASDGWLYLLGDNHLYGSTDGWQWTPVF